MADTMRAVLLIGHGGPEQLSVRDDVAVPHPAAGEVLIAVEACGMNNTDINTRVGWYSKSVSGATGADVAGSDADGSWGSGLTFPRIQGADPSGHIVAVGDGVDKCRVGERVMVDAWVRHPSGDLEQAAYLGSERDGGFAEFVAVPAENAYKIDTDMTAVELASFPCSYATAEHMLHRTGVTDGQAVLVTGASGGVGGALIQLAKRRGAQVVAVSSAAKMSAVSKHGADFVIDRSGDVAVDVLDAVGKVDVLADVVGGDGFAPLLEIVKRGGHYTTAGAIAGPIVDLDLRTLYLHDLTLHGATVLPPVVFENLVGYIERREIEPIVAATFPLEQIGAAQAAFMKKEHVGNMVIEL